MDANTVRMVGIKQNKFLKKIIMKIKLSNIIKSLAVIAILSSCEADDFLPEDGDSRDAFVGNWSVNELRTSVGYRYYLVDIEKNVENGARINLWNLYKLGTTDSVVASVSAIQSNTMTIPTQEVIGHTFTGQGTIDNDKINLIYYVNDGNTIDTATAVFTR